MSGKEIRTLSTHGNSCLLTYTIVLVGCQNQEVIWIYGFKIHRGSIVCFKLFWQWSSSHNIPIALCEDKLEFGHGGSDPYMQIARCYNLVVGVLTDHSTKNINASNFLTHRAPCFLICLIGTWCPSLILASVDLILPRAHVVCMWWVLWWWQTSCRTTWPVCFHARRSYPDSSSRSSKTVGGTSQGNIIFAAVRAQWECISTSATHTVLLAGLWLDLLESHLHLRPLASTSHAHYSNQQAKRGVWHLCPGPTMRTSDCFLPPSRLVPFLTFKSLSNLCLAPIHKMSTSIWQILG